jgi:NO-binding membrane sensor protein with MHYT domain
MRLWQVPRRPVPGAIVPRQREKLTIDTLVLSVQIARALYDIQLRSNDGRTALTVRRTERGDKTGTYNIWLQLLSFLVACIASHVALDAASRVSSASGNMARFWLIGGAVSMGTGIWSMHFIGMLAFELPTPMSDDVTMTLLSMLVAMLASGFALYTIKRDTLSWRRLLFSGLIMGLGIATMHYTGMGAMQMFPAIRYDTTLYILSILVAIAASIAALWIAFNLRSDDVSNVALKRMGAAIVMGVAIVGMHYTGMATANFAPNSVCLAAPRQVGNL